MPAGDRVVEAGRLCYLAAHLGLADRDRPAHAVAGRVPRVGERDVAALLSAGSGDEPGSIGPRRL